MTADVMRVKEMHHQSHFRKKGRAGDIGVRKASNRGHLGEVWWGGCETAACCKPGIPLLDSGHLAN
jgi:hypothetical protein